MTPKKLPKPSRNALDRANCTIANLRKATRAVTQVYNAGLRPVGLQVTQFTVISALARLGDTPLTRLADALVMDRTTLTRNLKPLVEKRLVRIEQDEDQRVRIVSLTDEGKTVLEDALPYWREAQSRLVDGLGQKRWSAFLDDLETTIGVAQNG